MRQFQVEYMGDAFAIMKELRRIGDQQRGLGAVQRQMIEYPFPYEREQRSCDGAVALIMTVRLPEIDRLDSPRPSAGRHAPLTGLVDLASVASRHHRLQIPAH